MRTLVCVSVSVLAAGASVYGREIVVDRNGGGEFTQIQSAIDVAEDGDTVLVKPGEYVISEPIDFNRLRDPEDPTGPPVKNITVRSEAGPEKTTVRMAETPAHADRASVVIFENREDEESVLEGFTLSGGQGTNAFLDEPIPLPPQWVWGNNERQGGGILCLKGSSPTLIRCVISGNSAYEGGGACCGWNSSLKLINSTISGNSATLGGGGVYCYGATVVGGTISGNSARFGGGVFCENGATLTRCIISGNSADSGGGVFCNEDGSSTVVNCTISGNSAELGGGVYCDEDPVTLVNCAVSGNSSVGVYCEDANPRLINCTITGNSNGGVRCAENSPLLRNCVVWDTGRALVQVDQEAAPVVEYSCFEDPLFVRSGHWKDDVWVEGDYHLQPGSPCIDAGISDGAPAFDIDGNGRPCGGGIDMGVYEMGDCQSPRPFQRGDANADGRRNITDAVFTLLFLFGGRAEPPCQKSADSDDDGMLTVTDPVFLLNFLFLARSPSPAAPVRDCGPDSTIDELTCNSFVPCEVP